MLNLVWVVEVVRGFLSYSTAPGTGMQIGKAAAAPGHGQREDFGEQ